MRAVIYARYSTDMQRDASLSDQVELCLWRDNLREKTRQSG